VLITWLDSGLPIVGVVVEIVVSTWVITPSCIWLHALEVLVVDRQNRCVGIMDVVPYPVGVVMTVSSG
jgi:hypothetical protein